MERLKSIEKGFGVRSYNILPLIQLSSGLLAQVESCCGEPLEGQHGMRLKGYFSDGMPRTNELEIYEMGHGGEGASQSSGRGARSACEEMHRGLIVGVEIMEFLIAAFFVWTVTKTFIFHSTLGAVLPHGSLRMASTHRRLRAAVGSK